jgi:hypothetical protein
MRDNVDLGGEGKRTARPSSPTPPLYMSAPLRLDYPAKRSPDYLPPGYSASRGGYSGLEHLRAKTYNF